MPQNPSDIPKMRKLQREVGVFASLARFNWLFRRFGKTGKSIANTLGEVRDMRVRVDHMLSILDSFNRELGPRGWIAYEMLDADIIERAANAVAGGDHDHAETILVRHFNEETIEVNMQWMRAIPAWGPRERLARLALADHVAGRYHAVVPIVLSIMDGIAFDLTNKTLFTEMEDAEFDAISGSGNGLKKLVKVFGSKRRKLNVEPIEIPYRHSILHGRDLNYDHEIVAAKAWAGLFAMRHWALRAVKHWSVAPEPDKEFSISEFLGQLRDRKSLETAIEAWTPRGASGRELEGVALDIVKSRTGTPEATTALFLDSWITQNYGKMAACLRSADLENIKRAAGTMRRTYGDFPLRGVILLRVEDLAPARAKVVASLSVQSVWDDGQLVDCEVEFVLIRENEDGSPVPSNIEGGSWGLNDGFLWRPLADARARNEDTRDRPGEVEDGTSDG